jgi:hypothetical protein
LPTRTGTLESAGPSDSLLNSECALASLAALARNRCFSTSRPSTRGAIQHAGLQKMGWRGGAAAAREPSTRPGGLGRRGPRASPRRPRPAQAREQGRPRRAGLPRGTTLEEKFPRRRGDEAEEPAAGPPIPPRVVVIIAEYRLMNSAHSTAPSRCETRARSSCWRRNARCSSRADL